MTNKFGVNVKGCSGTELFWCSKRSTADRIRKTIQAYKELGGWTGAATLRALVDLATKRLGKTGLSIAHEFIKNRKDSDQ